jgi:hypothetical protein
VVFSPTYQLWSLAALATYIAQQGHLPGVPAAEQVLRQGVDAAQFNATLLEKIEELTLYAIQQQNEINALKRLVKQGMKPRHPIGKAP